jgi:AcrR family transcriptional regulator
LYDGQAKDGVFEKNRDPKPIRQARLGRVSENRTKPTECLECTLKRKAEQTKARQAILAAYNQLILRAEGMEIRVAEIVREADVGRSTFYEHFPNTESLLREAISAPFRIFAEASLAQDHERLVAILRHFGEQQIQARSMMADARVRDQMTDVLVSQYETVIESSVKNADDRHWCALHLAESNLAMVRQWIAGKLVCDATKLAHLLIACSRQIILLTAEGDGCQVTT